MKFSFVYPAVEGRLSQVVSPSGPHCGNDSIVEKSQVSQTLPGAQMASASDFLASEVP